MEEIWNKFKKSPVEPLRLSLDSRFTFRCHKDISCFNRCCGELDLFLTPYDIIRMKKRLNITSGELLLQYSEPVILEKTQIPMIKLKMKESGRCRFVSEEGCTIYTDRPAVCRYYPLGMGTLKSKEVDDDEFFFFVKEAHCRGYEEEREWSVQEWRDDQEITLYDEMNKEWFEIILNKKLSSGKAESDEKSVRMFFMGSYDVDSFRDFVFKSKFLQIFDISDDELNSIKENEDELMKFAHRWLKYVLYKEPTMKLREGAEKNFSNRS